MRLQVVRGFRRKSPRLRSRKTGRATVLPVARKPTWSETFPSAPFQRQLRIATLPVPVGPPHHASMLCETRELEITLLRTTLFLEAYARSYSPPESSPAKMTPPPFPSMMLRATYV